MTLSLATINVNGLREKKKHDLVFNWLVAKQIDVICLQETHSTKDDLIRWQNEINIMHKINSIYNKCFKYYIGNTKFVLCKKCVDFAYFTMHIISYNCGKVNFQ
jgi:exonuclease III